MMVIDYLDQLLTFNKNSFQNYIWRKNGLSDKSKEEQEEELIDKYSFKVLKEIKEEDENKEVED